MKILLVDHECHRLTKSFAFLQRYLGESNSVETFYYARHGHCVIPREKVDTADWIVFLEFLPWRYRLGVPGKKNLFVPMYDNEWGSKWQWRRIAESAMHVLSFCGEVTSHALACGVPRERLLDVRYAVDPSRFENMRGNSRKLLLWERGEVGFSTVKSLFAPGDLDEVLVLRHPEEQIRHTEISRKDIADYHVIIKEPGFLPWEQYLDLLRPYGLVLAPRFKEGIGMSFLEPMAMGKVVIANDDATMCEAIRHGENGWLCDLRHPRRIDVAELRRIHDAGFDCGPVFQNWLEDRSRILRFFGSSTDALRSQALSPASLLKFALYLLEGFLYRASHISGK